MVIVEEIIETIPVLLIESGSLVIGVARVDLIEFSIAGTGSGKRSQADARPDICGKVYAGWLLREQDGTGVILDHSGLVAWWFPIKL